MNTVTALVTEAVSRLTDAGIETPRLDAELLLAKILGKDRRWLLTYPETSITRDKSVDFIALVERRCSHEPLPYILGEWEFYGRPFRVTGDVLIPRPETELLVESIVQWAKQHATKHVVDVGTGSGVIAVTLACELPEISVTAIDISPAALSIAHENACRHGVASQVDFLAGDLLTPLSRDDAPAIFDIVAANLPYIAEEERAQLMPEVREHEPHLALFAGEQGVRLIRRLIKDSPTILRVGGFLAMEVGYAQAKKIFRLLEQQRCWQNIQVVKDYAGIDRHLLAERCR